MSDDGTHAFTLIAFVGSVFSPYYAWARRRGVADPMNHCALNVALYGPRAARWSMTERGAEQVSRSATQMSIGRSHLDWSGGGLCIEIDEICAPIPRRLRGRIRIHPAAVGERTYFLDDARRHRWTPVAPLSHVEVQFDEPALSWSGIAYMDSNTGEEPLEDAFRRWTWSRAATSNGTIVLYDVMPRSPTAAGAARAMALNFGGDGTARSVGLPPVVELPTSGWRVARRTRADAGHGAEVRQTLEDAPFYSRSLLQTQLLGNPATAIHESLDLDRFASRWVQCLLPFRMPRRILVRKR